jgi:hypothetical protein
MYEHMCLDTAEVWDGLVLLDMILDAETSVRPVLQIGVVQQYINLVSRTMKK